MAHLHSFFVHFPIALLLVAVVFDVYGAWKPQSQSTQTALYLQLIAGISAILAAISGTQAESALQKQEGLSSAVTDAFSIHVTLGNLTVWIIMLVTVGRIFAVLEKKSWAVQGWVFPILSIGLGILVLTTGLLGGELSHAILQYFINN